MEMQQNDVCGQPDTDQIYSELESSPTLPSKYSTLSAALNFLPSLPPIQHSRFAKPKTSEEVLEARKLAVPGKTWGTV